MYFDISFIGSFFVLPKKISLANLVATLENTIYDQNKQIQMEPYDNLIVNPQIYNVLD